MVNSLIVADQSNFFFVSISAGALWAMGSSIFSSTSRLCPPTSRRESAFSSREFSKERPLRCLRQGVTARKNRTSSPASIRTAERLLVAPMTFSVTSGFIAITTPDGSDAKLMDVTSVQTNLQASKFTKTVFIKE
ncbi:hypothetical protein CPB83DRAFT_102675 [Crepidotus variabilis]|uniref:Uncharacterized protein n=1 Tax=Crepidotus variabilis TaxID=179855 RepID=A0A9P6JT23_9AGAR|nr:hypothetical protein CPB83DRAFT_102675 [Crepidotus variabilis]